MESLTRKMIFHGKYEASYLQHFYWSKAIDSCLWMIFSQPLRDFVVEMKQRACLTCEISDADAPVQWLFNNEPISSTDHLISLEKGQSDF